MKIVVDVTSNRIIWFTTENDPIVLNPGTALTDYNGEWPTEITHLNCWNWVLRDRLVEPHQAKPPANLFETNRKHTIDLLYKRINARRADITKDVMFEETVHLKKVASAREYLASGTASWILGRLASIWETDMTDAAKRIIDEWTQKERMLLQTEAQLAEYQARIEKTTTSEEVLALHEEILKL